MGTDRSYELELGFGGGNQGMGPGRLSTMRWRSCREEEEEAMRNSKWRRSEREEPAAADMGGA